MVNGIIFFDIRIPLIVIAYSPSPPDWTLDDYEQWMRRRLQSRKVTDLARQLETIWQEIPLEAIQELYQPTSSRMTACMDPDKHLIGLPHFVTKKLWKK